MVNPFEDPSGVYSVLINAEGQYSLWPSAVHVPGGWQAVLEHHARDECLEFVERNWTDMRPQTLQQEMASFPLDRRTSHIAR